MHGISKIHREVFLRNGFAVLDIKFLILAKNKPNKRLSGDTLLGDRTHCTLTE